jgi:hypothetical protein
MTTNLTRFLTIPCRLSLALILGLVPAAQAVVLTTGDTGQITAFQTGATVETFDNIAGITAVNISNYDPIDIGGTTALFNKNPATSAFFNSGGASFNDPVGNPGTPIGIAAPSGGISGDVFSGANVAGALGVVSTTLFEAGGFMEVIFPTAVSKVGLYVTHGSIQLILKDLDNLNIATGDASGTASKGQFLGITRDSADVRGVTIIGNGTFTIDDFTYGTSGGSAPGVPEPDMGLAGVLAFLALVGVPGFKALRRRPQV